MRVIAGVAGGRPLAVPPGARPTSDRAREALFSSLESLLGGWSGVHVLDLYAGSGALAIEALSRGAAGALLVESLPAAVDVIRRNLRAAGVTGATVLREKVERLAGRAADAAYELVVADPPYALGSAAVSAVLADLAGHGWLAPGGLVVVERSKRAEPLVWPDVIAPLRERRYGEALLWYGRAT